MTRAQDTTPARAEAPQEYSAELVPPSGYPSYDAPIDPARAEAQDEGAGGEIKPCPFCGTKAVIGRSQRAITVGCDFNDCPSRECYSAGRIEDETAVIAAWNARAHPSPTPAADDDRVLKKVEPVARVELTIGRWNILWLGGNVPDGTLLYLQPALDDLRKDAERYCFLRSRDPGPDGKLPSAGPFIGQVPENYILTERDADNAIDQALAALKSEGK